MNNKIKYLNVAYQNETAKNIANILSNGTAEKVTKKKKLMFVLVFSFAIRSKRVFLFYK